MQAQLRVVDGFTLESTCRGHAITMDSAPPVGRDKGPTPKELVLQAVMGCSAMDIIGLLRKAKISPATLTVTGDTEQTDAHPRVFRSIALTFGLSGEGIDASKFNEAITLSLTKYCGVSAMVYKVVPITWRAQLNGQEVGTGKSEFGI